MGALELGRPGREVDLGGDVEEVNGAVLEGEPLGGAPLTLRVYPLDWSCRHEETLPEGHPALPACEHTNSTFLRLHVMGLGFSR